MRGRTDTLRQRAWRAMRLLKRFTLPDLLVLAARQTDRQAECNAGLYLRQLIKDGYAALLPQKQKRQSLGRGLNVYRLLRDTGPIAPAWSKGRLTDRNEERHNG